MTAPRKAEGLLEFTRSVELPVSQSKAFRWHARPGALQRLSPPWDPVEVVAESGTIEAGARVTLRLKAGPLPARMTWQAVHTRYEPPHLFQDRQEKGPFAFWEHTHVFHRLGDKACRLEDRIRCRLPVHPWSGMAAAGWLRRRLERIFTYRHNTLAEDLKAHSRFGQRSLTILVSGASGLVGSALVPMLTTGGHRVIRLVRRPGSKRPNERFWDPAAGFIDLQGLPPIDAVVHLSGENIGKGRWTPAKKKLIITSRDRTTSLLATAIAGLDPRPQAFLCASAIGFYGDRGGKPLSEEDACGIDFISGVCSRWEKAASPARQAGIRTVLLRIGIALSPRAGALARMLPLFRLGLGGPMGDGGQYMSWIGIDDVIGAIYWAMGCQNLEGPVNLVAPAPVTNAEFTAVLARVLGRRARLRVPAAAIRMLYGQMGREIVLASTRVLPEKLLASGYRFRHPDLEDVLRHLLGRWPMGKI